MTLKIYTDGGSKGNPGSASVGMVFYLSADRQDLDGKEVFKYREDIGFATNNAAEYTAVIKALEKLKNQITSRQPACAGRPPIANIEFYSDSRLLVNQVNGFFKVKNAVIREFIFKIRILEQEIGLPISYHLIPREENKEADKLVNS